MIVLIAILHAIPVLVVGHKSESRRWAVFAAILMVIVGVFSGNPAYMAVDIVAVGLALWFVYSTTDAPVIKPTREASSEQAPPTSTQSSDGAWGIVFWALVIFLGYSYFQSNSRIKSQPQVSQPSTHVTTTNSSSPAETPVQYPTPAPSKPTYIRPPVSSQKLADKPRRQSLKKACKYNVDMSDDDYHACGSKPPSNKRVEVSAPPLPVEPVPVEPYVFDKGGHQGYPPKCRWLSQYEWSCK